MYGRCRGTGVLLLTRRKVVTSDGQENVYYVVLKVPYLPDPVGTILDSLASGDCGKTRRREVKLLEILFQLVLLPVPAFQPLLTHLSLQAEARGGVGGPPFKTGDQPNVSTCLSVPYQCIRYYPSWTSQTLRFAFRPA